VAAHAVELLQPRAGEVIAAGPDGDLQAADRREPTHAGLADLLQLQSGRRLPGGAQRPRPVQQVDNDDVGDSSWRA
jgi:hypothetical protein